MTNHPIDPRTELTRLRADLLDCEADIADDPTCPTVPQTRRCRDRLAQRVAELVAHPAVLDTIHGYAVIESTDYVKRSGMMPTRAVLVRRDERDYVTALQVAPLGVPAAEWLHGHYFDDLSEAAADYAERAAKLTR